MRRIYKYATGEEIPEGAVYVATVTQTRVERCMEVVRNGLTFPTVQWSDCWLVWHYFLIEDNAEKESTKA